MAAANWLDGLTEKLIPTRFGLINVRAGGRVDGPAMVYRPSPITGGAMRQYQYEHFVPTHRMVPAGVPVLVIAGAEAGQFPAHAVRKMADATGGNTFRVLPRTGRLAAPEDPDEAPAEVDAYLAGLSAVTV
ncbi:alpha/beta fold hydrolase [Streptomyces celluloflavus]|uniref:Alpha/beta fold hydrolase n=1 Tax=Streptomyces celluloflavus TaxID=58344 RepID=A0ABW7RAQ1_9ACTN